MTRGTWALVTGASSGIGAAIAQVLAERGYNLVLSARRLERLEAAAQTLSQAHGVEVHVLPMDLAEPGAADRLYEQVRGLGQPIGMLVNNAGFGAYGISLELDPERVRRMLELNVVALTTLTHRIGADMLRAGHGHILQLASIAAFQPSPLYAVYAATKAYVLSMSLAMHHELRGRGVTVTTVNPGLTSTEFHEKAEHLKPQSLDFLQMDAISVARAAVDAALAGRPVVTTGMINKLAALGAKLVPRAFATAAAARLMSGRRE